MKPGFDSQVSVGLLMIWVPYMIAGSGESDSGTCRTTDCRESEMKYGHPYHPTDLADTAKPVTSRIRVEWVFL
ncbi:MAG: hypothetical protein ACR2N1_13035 [Rubripirellula sp.]